MKIKSTVFIFILASGVFGQTRPSTGDQNIPTNQSSTSIPSKTDPQRRTTGLPKDPYEGKTYGVTEPRDFDVLPEPRLTKEQKQQTTIPKDELAKYADFLKQPKTGIFKILPNLCGDTRVIDVRNEKCLNKDIPSIAHYSFRRRLYDFQDWTDLRYQDKQFAVGLKSTIIGLIAETADDRFDSLNEESAEVKALSEIQLPKKGDEIRAKKKEIEDGLMVSSLKFSDKANVSLNKTYLLRSHAYRMWEAAINDRRIDLIVAFKIVAIDENEGLTIIWKELYKGNSNWV